MRLFDFFGRAPVRSQPAQETLSEPDSDRSGMFNLEDTTRLHQLFETPRERRDDCWKEAFFGACWNASIFLPEPAFFNGPDGLPYFRLNLPTPGMSFEAHCLAGMAPTCLDRNAGAAFFSSARDPVEQSQWVVSMGEIDSFTRFGHLNGDPVDAREANAPAADTPADEAGVAHRTAIHDEQRSVLVSSPSRDFLPAYTAHALHRLLASWGEIEPKVALVVDPTLRPSRHLVVSRKRSQFQDENEAQFELSRAAWMLPPHRGIMLMPEDWSSSDMTSLSELF